MIPLFSPHRIAAAQSAAVPGLSIEVVAETVSTNADLMTRAASLSAPLLLIAEQQSGGRGRAGRNWQSVRGDSLTCSLAWRFALPVQSLLGLPLVVGIALADALATFDLPVQLKWPNDVLYDGRKLAGVLIETSITRPPSSSVWAVIGIGVNLADTAALASRLDQPMAALSHAGFADRDLLVARLLDHLCALLVQFERDGFAAFTARWNALHLHRAQRIQIVDHGEVLHEGIAHGVDDFGRLLLDTAERRIVVAAGDVSLRTEKA